MMDEETKIKKNFFSVISFSGNTATMLPWFNGIICIIRTLKHKTFQKNVSYYGLYPF
jgi:hypothetical protein